MNMLEQFYKAKSAFLANPYYSIVTSFVFSQSPLVLWLLGHPVAAGLALILFAITVGIVLLNTDTDLLGVIGYSLKVYVLFVCFKTLVLGIYVLNVEPSFLAFLGYLGAEYITSEIVKQLSKYYLL